MNGYTGVNVCSQLVERREWQRSKQEKPENERASDEKK